jgi:hypothetical protein
MPVVLQQLRQGGYPVLVGQPLNGNKQEVSGMSTTVANVIWWKFNYGEDAPRAVEGPAVGWPSYDADGEQMFLNSHFDTEEKAWRSALDNAKAGVSLSTTRLRRAEEELRDATQYLANDAARFIELERAYERRMRQETSCSSDNPSAETNDDVC